MTEAIAVATTDSRNTRSALGAALHNLRVRQYFNVVVGARDVARAVRSDARFLDTVRCGLAPLPSDRQPAAGRVFGPLAAAAPPPLARCVGEWWLPGQRSPGLAGRRGQSAGGQRH